MNATLLISAWLLPLLIAPFAFSKWARWLISLAALPAISAALILEQGQMIHLPWLLLGTYLGIDEVSRWLLLASAFIWLIASVYALMQKISARFLLFFSMAMAGNFLLLLAIDMVSFYLGFALMGLSTTVLIIERTRAENFRSLRLYLTWTIAGELVLFSAIVFLATHSENLRFDTVNLTGVNSAVLFLVVIGFGIKIALPGLHFWMPATYNSLPIAAAAVVSGPMISAGMLGLIRFLNPGGAEHALIGQGLLIAGVLSTGYATMIGLVQSQARAALAYSSMSKMGLLAAALGIALMYPAQAPVLVMAIVVFTLHHLLIKSALFFAVGIAEQTSYRTALIVGLVFLVVSLAGFPLTSGALTKAQLSTAIPGELNHFVLALAIASFFSALLIARILYLIFHSKAKTNTMPVTVIGLWLLLVIAIMGWPWLVTSTQIKWVDVMVLLTASGIVLAVWRFKPSWLTRYVGLIPPGDISHIFNSAYSKLIYWLHRYASALTLQQRLVFFKRHIVQWVHNLNKSLLPITQRTMAWRSAGATWLIIGLVMFITLFIEVGFIDIGERQ